MKKSICIATYNGENYIEAQLRSILDQINTDDEFIIVDDCSIDNTVKFVGGIRDERIKLVTNQCNQGINKTFEKALSIADGDIVFLSDQDDVWFKNKVTVITELFKKDVDIIQHDVIIVDANMVPICDSFFKLRNAGSGIIKNYISNTYLGCGMVLKRKVINSCLPIIEHSGYHDRWIGIIAELQGYKILFTKEKLMYYIRHQGTGSNLKRRSLLKILFDRIDFLKAIFIFYLKKFWSERIN